MRKRPLHKWKITHPEHPEAHVVAPSRYEAIISAAKSWGVPWSTVARESTYTDLGEATI